MKKIKLRRSGLQVGGLLAIAMAIFVPPVGLAMLGAYFVVGYVVNEVVNPRK